VREKGGQRHHVSWKRQLADTRKKGKNGLKIVYHFERSNRKSTSKGKKTKGEVKRNSPVKGRELYFFKGGGSVPFKREKGEKEKA